MRLFLWIPALLTISSVALGAETGSREVTIKNLLTKHKTWTMLYELTDNSLPGARAHGLKYEFTERDNKLVARLVVEFGGCDFEVPIRPNGISMRWCLMQGEPLLTFDPSDAKFPFKDVVNPRKLWMTPSD